MIDTQEEIQRLKKENKLLKDVCAEWFDKTEWVQKSATAQELGMHRADVLRKRIENLLAASAGEYPPLPIGEQSGFGHYEVYEAEDMRAYADATCAMRAAPPQKAQEPVAWRDAVLDLIDDCPGLTMEQDRWLSCRVKELTCLQR